MLFQKCLNCFEIDNRLFNPNEMSCAGDDAQLMVCKTSEIFIRVSPWLVIALTFHHQDRRCKLFKFLPVVFHFEQRLKGHYSGIVPTTRFHSQYSRGITYS